MWIKFQRANLTTKDQFTDLKQTKQFDKEQKIKQMNKQKLIYNKQTGQLWRFEACLQTSDNKIKRIMNKNLKYLLFRNSEESCTFNFLIHLLYYLFCTFNYYLNNLHFSKLNFKLSSSISHCLPYLNLTNLYNYLYILIMQLVISIFNLNSKLRTKLNYKSLLVIIFALFNALTICNANESCFGGIETFEKTAMFDYNTEIKPAGTLLQQMDQALTRDCINQCKNQPVCTSFGLDYTKFICAAYQYKSSQNLAPNHHLRDKLQLTNTTNYFEKVCYKGMSREEYQRICGLERLWAFERVMDAFLDGFEDLSIPSVASKEDCAKQCLIETTFNCRSADFDHTSKICRLSREDRRTQPQAFRQMFGSKRDYLENQCAAAGM